jgi:hypothetical protein
MIMASWSTTLRVVDSRNEQPISNAGVQSVAGLATTNSMGEAAFTFVDEVEWFIATVTRQNYNSKSQIIHGGF